MNSLMTDPVRSPPLIVIPHPRRARRPLSDHYPTLTTPHFRRNTRIRTGRVIDFSRAAPRAARVRARLPACAAGRRGSRTLSGERCRLSCVWGGRPLSSQYSHQRTSWSGSYCLYAKWCIHYSEVSCASGARARRRPRRARSAKNCIHFFGRAPAAGKPNPNVGVSPDLSLRPSEGVPPSSGVTGQSCHGDSARGSRSGRGHKPRAHTLDEPHEVSAPGTASGTSVIARRP
jgi:hypothetical protein